MDYEYTCTNGTYIIGTPGNLAHAKDVRDRNRASAMFAGDLISARYYIVRRKASKLLADRPGKWESFELVKS